MTWVPFEESALSAAWEFADFGTDAYLHGSSVQVNSGIGRWAFNTYGTPGRVRIAVVSYSTSSSDADPANFNYGMVQNEGGQFEWQPDVFELEISDDMSQLIYAPSSVGGTRQVETYHFLIEVWEEDDEVPDMPGAFATVRITVLGGDCEDLAADTVLHSADADPDRESFNCECEDGDRNVDTLCNLRERMVRRLGFVDPLSDGTPRTLAALRRDLLVRLGHAGSIDRPPPGMRELLDQIIAESEQLLWDRLELDRGDAPRPARMEEDEDTTTLSPVLIFAQALGTAKAHAGKQDAQLYMQQAEKHLQDYVRQSPPGLRKTIDDFLREAQRFLFEKVASFRQTRFFRWPLEEGVRLYGFGDNEGGCGPFVPELVEGVYVSHGDDEREQWRELQAGIDPRLYHAGIRTNWPQRYELRRCIEVWPAPDDRGGYLRIKGKFDLNRFTHDEDKSTIDADLIFMLALANAKAHFNQPDAQKYDQLAQSRIGDIIAGSHHTRRYIPVDGVLPSANPPIAKDGFIPN